MTCLTEINFDNIPNIKNIGKQYMEQSRQFDPENKYSVPYCWGTVGILYNKTMVDEPVDSWSILWNPKYKDNILMQDSVRDAFGATLKYLGYSLNSTDLDELTEAKNLLIEQKPLVQAYVIDQVRDKMIGNEAAHRRDLFRRGDLYTERKSEPGIRDPEGRLQYLDRFLGNSEKCRAQGECREIHQLPLQTGHCADEL